MAIKVNGTTVINDSRALTNIASVDATTVAAIGAAGVGGLTTLITEDASMGSGAQLKLSLGDYDEQIFLISNLRHNSSTPDVGKGGLGLTTTSNALLTGQEYLGIDMRLKNSYQVSGLGTGTAYYNNYALTVNSYFPSNNTAGGAVNAGRIDGMVRVRNAKSTTKPTELFARFHASYINSPSESWMSTLTYSMRYTTANNHICFYFQTSGSTYASGGTYTSWGVN